MGNRTGSSFGTPSPSSVFVPILEDARYDLDNICDGTLSFLPWFVWASSYSLRIFFCQLDLLDRPPIRRTVKQQAPPHTQTELQGIALTGKDRQRNPFAFACHNVHIFKHPSIFSASILFPKYLRVFQVLEYFIGEHAYFARVLLPLFADPEDLVFRTLFTGFRFLTYALGRFFVVFLFFVHPHF